MNVAQVMFVVLLAVRPLFRCPLSAVCCPLPAAEEPEDSDISTLLKITMQLGDPAEDDDPAAAARRRRLARGGT